MVCPKCGVELPENPTVCKSCGTEFRMMEGYDYRKARQKKPRKLALILIILVLVVAAVIIFFLIKGFGKGSSEVDKTGGTSESVVDDADVDEEEGEDQEDGASVGAPEEGEYQVVAVEVYGQWVDAEGFITKDDRIVIKMKKNGTAVFRFGDSSEKVKWTKDGSKLTFTTKDGMNVAEKMEDAASYFEWKDGMILYHASMGTDGMTGTTVFAREGTDLSGYDILSPEAFQEQIP
ncbi:MAG: zinc ribbon domain-containing protein [Eubacterium sp.]|nr:zinc ribbon domain-containing protein [Eubacterium sp.]